MTIFGRGKRDQNRSRKLGRRACKTHPLRSGIEACPGDGGRPRRGATEGQNASRNWCLSVQLCCFLLAVILPRAGGLRWRHGVRLEICLYREGGLQARRQVGKKAVERLRQPRGSSTRGVRHASFVKRVSTQRALC